MGEEKLGVVVVEVLARDAGSVEGSLQRKSSRFVSDMGLSNHPANGSRGDDD